MGHCSLRRFHWGHRRCHGQLLEPDTSALVVACRCGRVPRLHDGTRTYHPAGYDHRAYADDCSDARGALQHRLCGDVGHLWWQLAVGSTVGWCDASPRGGSLHRAWAELTQ